MTSTLTDRYVHATVRSVPEARRDEIAAELRSSIDDMVAGRVEAGEPADAAERAVLTDLGEPGRLASRYTGEKLQLIGPRYFLVWKRLTIRLMIWVPALVGLVSAGSAWIDGDGGDAVGGFIGGLLAGIVHVGFWTTLAFAILERADVDSGIPEWTVDRLPSVPRKRDIPVAEPIAAIVWFVVVAVFLVISTSVGFVAVDGGDRLPLLDAGLWSGWLPLILLSVVLSIALEIVKLVTGRWTWGLAVGNLLASALFLVAAGWPAVQRELLNPDLVASFGWDADAYRYASIGITIGVAAALLYSVIDGFVSAARHARSPIEPLEAVR